MKTLLVTLLLLLATFNIHGQASPASQGGYLDPVKLPGSMWSSSGNLDPTYKADVVTENYVEQGYILLLADHKTITGGPFVSVGFAADTSHLVWNNNITPQIGAKVSKYFNKGMISGSTGYMREQRFMSTPGFGSRGALVKELVYWVGWSPISDRKSRFPGSAWGIVGNLSPVEHGDYMVVNHASQSFILSRFQSSDSALLPYVDATINKDKLGYDWENKATLGCGIKIGHVSQELYSEFGVGYIYEDRFHSGQKASGVIGFMNVSYSWNLLERAFKEGY